MGGFADSLRVEIEFVPGTWTDVTDYVEWGLDPLGCGHGRSNPYEQCSVGDLSLLLDNADGRFTPNSATITDPTTGTVSANPLYPYVQENKAIRVRAMHGNLLASIDPSFETSVAGVASAFAFWDTATLAQSSTYAQSGTQSCRITFPASVSGSAGAQAYVLTIPGQTYTLSAYVRSNSTQPDWMPTVYFVGDGTTVTTKNAMTRGTYTFTATDWAHYMGVRATTYSAGKLIYLDAMQLDLGSSALTYRGDGVNRFLFTGTIDSYSVMFPGGDGTKSRVAIGASDKFKTLARRRLRSVYEEVSRSAGAFSFFPLSVEDDETVPFQVTDSISTSGTGTIIQPIDNPAAVQDYSNEEKPRQLAGSLAFQNSILTGGLYRPGQGAGVLSLEKPYTLPDTFTLSAACWFKTSNPDNALAYLLDFDGDVKVYICETAGEITMLSSNASVFSTVQVNDGEWHHFVVTTTLALGTNYTVAGWLDGQSLGSDSDVDVHYVDDRYKWLINGSQTGWLGVDNPLAASKVWGSADVTYSGLVVSSTDLGPVAADLYNAGHDNISGESVASRVTRLMGWAGVTPWYAIATDTAATIGSQDTQGQSALDALQALAATEGAPAFIDGSGYVIFQSRAHRATTTPVATFDGATDITDASSLTLTLADEGVVNQVTATIAGGPSVTAYVSDAMSDYMLDSMSASPLSPIEDDIEGLWEDIDQARGAAERRLAERFQARLRFPQIVIDPLTASADIWAAALDLEIGDLIRVTGLTSAQAGGSSQRDLFVESIRWEFSDTVGRVTLDTSALDRSLGWVKLDDTSTGRCGHDAGVMTVGTVGCLSGTGTGTFTCATSSGPLWTTTGGDFPLGVKIEEEELTISGISGGASPQTFTVSARGANGTVATAHASGSFVQLYPIPVYAQ